MATERMPNGQLVDFAPGTSPEVKAQVRARYAAPARPTLTARPAAPDPRAADIQRRAANMAQASDLTKSLVPFANGATGDMARAVQRGASMYLKDPVQSAISAGIASLGGKNFRDEYTRNQEAAHLLANKDYGDHPIRTGAAEFAGSMIVPVGEATGLARLTPNAAKAAAATKVGRVVAKAASTPVGVAIRTGANMGALNAAGATVDKGDISQLPEAMMAGAAGGGALGGMLGGAARAGSHIAQVIGDRAASNASNVAYRKIADLLSRAHSGPTGKGPVYSPESAVREMNVSAARGNEPMLADLSPEMNNVAGHLAREPGNPAANELVTKAEDRSLGILDRFHAKLRSLSNVGDDAYAATNTVNATRKGAGAIDYSPGGVMDTHVPNTPELEKFFKDSPDASRLLEKAYVTAQRFGENLQTLQRGVGTGEPKLIPTLRVFDYLKREFNGAIGEAMNKGNTTLAAGLSRHLSDLKKVITDAAPGYEHIVANQRNLFQKADSLVKGQGFLKQMRTVNGPRELMDTLKSSSNLDEHRLGMIDALLHTDNPIATMRSLSSTPEKRAVMVQVMGGTKEFNLFDRFIRREIRGMGTDRMLARGKQSATNALGQAGNLDEGHAAAQLGTAMVKGGSFGGPTGAAANAIAKLDQLNRGMGPRAREELARALMGRGEGLPAKVAASKAHYAKRRAQDKRIGRYAGRAGGTVGGNVQE